VKSQPLLLLPLNSARSPLSLSFLCKALCELPFEEISISLESSRFELDSRKSLSHPNPWQCYIEFTLFPRIPPLVFNKSFSQTVREPLSHKTVRKEVSVLLPVCFKHSHKLPLLLNLHS
jgi:hypothetical protein